ncbi:MAG: hypothetical protein PHX60_14155 [Giesbergeria sp.]|uniref:hypothetical protein n=1 Tax=Giesbergeria sp. TaxID=2818473 RepID=UPI00262B9D57|nr:hypothetical protein [Giesbergeria sp.]MDD2610803.1 hypothetical protein [Giesbergeria sp.]
MNANKYTIRALLIASALALPFSAQAVQGLDSSGQTKVNKALAERWVRQDNTQKKTPAEERRVTNIGSRRDGTCNVNVGTAQPDSRGRAPRNIVVTTKEVVNVCR